LASLAFGNIGFWLCDTVGAIFGGMAVVNLIRYFGDDKEAPSEVAAKEEPVSSSWGGSPTAN
jgi:hypothetical protein